MVTQNSKSDLPLRIMRTIPDILTYTLCVMKSISTGNCGGAAGICRFFYDSAPSGQFGTFCYIVKAAMALFRDKIPTEKENIECLPM